MVLRRSHRVILGIFPAVYLFASSSALCVEYISQAPYGSESEAADVGRELSIGSTRLEGPGQVEVLTYQTWTLVYTAGKAGIRPGGGIRIAMRHVPRWTAPQNDDPKADGYLTVSAAGDRPVQTVLGHDSKQFFSQYFPWQNIVEVTLPENGLGTGETIRITYGDRSGGSPGIRIQPFDESSFVFKVYVDALGNGDYLPMIDNPSIEIVPAEPHRLTVVMPSDAIAGKPVWCVVRAEDRYGNPATQYRGTLQLRSSDPIAQLPPEYRFTESDRGVHRFENVSFRSPGIQTIAATDGTFEHTGNPVRALSKAPERLLLWGDLHGHTLFSDGRGTVEEFYDFAERVAGLDFCAVTDHAFEIMDPMWAHSKKVTNQVHKPGRFVTFQAYEWSGITGVGGDHNVFFLDDDPPLYRSRSYYDYLNLQMYHGSRPQVNHIEDLFATLADLMRDQDIFCIPHYGGRPGNPAWHNAKVQRMIEVFSEHQRSEEWMTTFLQNGHRLGIIASTDGHFGNPGYGYLKPVTDWDAQEIGMAAVAVYAPERTRESIFRALYNRRVYATSGDRIILAVHADGHPMGSEYTSRTAPLLTVEAVGTASIATVEIKKNSEVVHTERPGDTQISLEWRDPQFDTGSECYYYVRILQENNEEAISSPIWVN